MEILPDDIQQLIFFFLSTKDKISILNINSNYRRNIRPISVLIPKMEYYMERVQCINTKLTNEMLLLIDDIFIPYRDINLSSFNGVNPLYCRNRMENMCIVEKCREKKLDYIYIRIFYKSNIPYYLNSSVYKHSYIKRKMPYCLKCFKIWYH
jgi:hypothetical protein